MRSQRREQAGGTLGLVAAGVVQLDVGVALEPVLDVPPRLAVPPEHQPRHGEAGQLLGVLRRYGWL